MKEKENAKRAGLKKADRGDKVKVVRETATATPGISKSKRVRLNVEVPQKRKSKSPIDGEELHELRRIRLSLAKGGLSVEDLAQTLRVLKKHDTKPPDFLSLAAKGEEMERRYGMPYHAIVEDYAEKSELLEKATAKLEAARQVEKEIEGHISDARALRKLQDFLDANKIEATSLTNFIQKYREFVRLGFDLETMASLVDELVRQGFEPVESGKTVGSWLTKNRTIAEALLRAEQSLEAIKNEESLTISRIESLVRKAEQSQKKIDALESYFGEKSRSLESEYDNRQRAMNVRMSEERRRAEAETFEILRERDRLRSENRMLKEEEETMKKELELARSISTLIRNPRGLTPSHLDSITLELGRVKEDSPREGDSEPKPQDRLLEARRQFLLALRETVNA